ncbi:MAG: hypothetical protein ACRDF1_09585 [bacterium]
MAKAMTTPIATIAATVQSRRERDGGAGDGTIKTLLIGSTD